MRIRRIDIENFRGIRSASWRLPAERRFFALIGPGDATKTTVLTAIERALHDRAGLSVLDTDFYGATVDEPLRIRVAVDDLPDELIAMDAFGAFLAGIDKDGEWTHDPADDSERCIIVELLVEADLDPVWQSYRPQLGGVDDDDPHPIRARHRTQMTAYRIDDRVDAHLRWSRTSSLGRLTVSRDDTRSTLTHAGRKAREAAAEAVTDSLKALAREVQTQVQAIGTTKFGDLRPGLDMSLTNTQGNLALFDGDIPLTNFGLGTRRLTGAATQQLANQGTSTLLVDEVEHGLEPHRLVHLLRHLRTSDAFSQVFVTTHSPTALMHLEPEDLVMVRSANGTTELKPLGEPAELRPLLKACPEAFLARRIVINEGKTEYGVVLEHLDEWDEDTDSDAVPSAALGVVAIEGNGGPGSAGRAAQFLNLGYQTVLFMDSDDDNANTLADQVAAGGGAVIRWDGDHSIETAVCAELSGAGLTAFIEVAIEVAEDPDSARTTYATALITNGAPDGCSGADTLDVSTWASAGVDLNQARDVVGKTAKGKSKDKGWFKRVDKGRRLGRFILDTPELQAGDVKSKIDALKEAIYAPSEPEEASAPLAQEAAPDEPSEPQGVDQAGGDDGNEELTGA